MDKRPLYLWVFAIFANIGAYLYLVKNSINSGYYGNFPWFSSITGAGLSVLAFSLFISVLPIWLSGINFKWRAYFGYGIPAVIIAYSALHFFTCQGKFCNLLDPLLIVGGIVFAVFFAIGTHLRKWDAKIILSLLFIEIIALIFLIFIVAQNSNLNSTSAMRLNSLQEEVQKTANSTEIGRICDSLVEGPHKTFRSDCWTKAMALYPNIDVCAWSNLESSKKECLFYEGLLNQNSCEGKDSQESYNKKDDPVEDTKLIQCWKIKAKTYPGLDICQWTYEWNKQKCVDSLKNILS